MNYIKYKDYAKKVMKEIFFCLIQYLSDSEYPSCIIDRYTGIEHWAILYYLHDKGLLRKSDGMSCFSVNSCTMYLMNASCLVRLIKFK